MTALDIICEPEKMKACNVELINVDTQTKEILNLQTGSFTKKRNTIK